MISYNLRVILVATGYNTRVIIDHRRERVRDRGMGGTYITLYVGGRGEGMFTHAGCSRIMNA